MSDVWISELKIKNYRPFYGEQIIPFKEDSLNKFTIIEAKSDTGKTSLLSAVCWCLYGKDLGKDVHEKKMHPFNLRRKEELEEGKSDEILVEITICDDGETLPRYQIKRTARCAKEDGRMHYVFDDQTRPVFIEWENNEANPIQDQDYCRGRINSILPEDIHMFFLFEGEKLESRFDFKSPDNIRNAIEKVSQIQHVKNALTHLNVVRDKVFSEKRGGKDTQIQRNKQEIEAYRADIERMTEKVNGFIEDREITEGRIREIDRTLEKVNIPLISKWIEERKRFEEENNKNNKDLMALQTELSDMLLREAPLSICSSALKDLLALIEESSEKNELPPNIGNVYIKELLDGGQCVCGRGLDTKDPDDKEARETLSNLLRQKDLSDVAETLLMGKFVLNELVKDLPNRRVQGRDSIFANIKGLRNTIAGNSVKLEKVNEDLKNYDQKKIMNLNEEREQLKHASESTFASITRVNAAIKQKEIDIKRLRRSNDELAKKLEGYEDMRKTAEFLDRANASLTKIQDELLNEVRTRVESHTYEFFKKLHWDTSSYHGLIIDEGYHLSLKDPNGNERIFGLSSGTKQVFLLSFISALSDVSGFKFPIFIDTPLAHTDNEQRMNIATRLPNYLKGNQVIMLMKDQEYTPDFRNTIKDHISTEYRLVKQGGLTEVRPWD